MCPQTRETRHLGALKIFKRNVARAPSQTAIGSIPSSLVTSKHTRHAFCLCLLIGKHYLIGKLALRYVGPRTWATGCSFRSKGVSEDVKVGESLGWVVCHRNLVVGDFAGCQRGAAFALLRRLLCAAVLCAAKDPGTAVLHRESHGDVH